MNNPLVRRRLSFIKKNKLISFSLIIFLTSLLFICVMSLRIFIQNKQVITFTKSERTVTGSANLDIKMEIPFKADNIKNCWQEWDGSWGSQYDIYIYNKSDAAFLDWNLVMTIPTEGRIDSSWNADYVHTIGKISITGIDSFFTTVIHPHNSIKLGFVLYSNNLMNGVILSSPAGSYEILSGSLLLSLLWYSLRSRSLFLSFPCSSTTP